MSTAVQAHARAPEKTVSMGSTARSKSLSQGLRLDMPLGRPSADPDKRAVSMWVYARDRLLGKSTYRAS